MPPTLSFPTVSKSSRLQNSTPFFKTVSSCTPITLVLYAHVLTGDIDPDLQRSSKPIAKGTLNIEIYERDLLTEVQKPQFAGMPNYTSNVAGVTWPFKVFFGKLIGSKEFDNLVILSAKR